MSIFSKSIYLLNDNKEKFLLAAFSVFGFTFGALAFLIQALPITLFLSFFSGKEFSYFMIANASLAVVIGLIFGELQKKLSLKSGLFLQHVFLIGIMAIVAFLGLTVSVKIASMFFLLMMQIVSSLNYLGFANTINGVLSLDFSKKYYGYISAAVSAGKIITIAFLPFILKFIGESLTLTTVFFTQSVFTALNLSIIIIFYTVAPSTLETSKKSSKSMHKYWKDPLAIIVLTGFFLSFTICNIWGLSFYSLVGKVYKSSVEIAQFICFFNFVQVGLEFILGCFFLNSILRAYGAGTSLAINIFVALVTALLIMLLRPFLPLPILTVGGLVPGTLIYFAFNSVFFLSVSNLTLSSMQEPLRNWTNALGNMVFCPLGIAVGGYIFAFYYENYGFVPLLILVTLAVLGLLHYLVCLLWERYYLKKLDQALSKQTVMEPHITFGLLERALILRRFKAGSLNERLFLAGLVKNRDEQLLVEIVKELISSDVEEEKQAAHYFIQKKKLSQFTATIVSLPLNQEVLETLKVIDNKEFECKVLEVLKEKRGPFLHYCLKEALEFGDNSIALSIWEEVKDSDPKEALEVMSSSMKTKKLHWIIECLNNKNFEIKQLAFKNLPLDVLKDEWDLVYPLLSEETFRSLFVSVLKGCKMSAQAFQIQLKKRPELLENIYIQKTLVAFLGVHRTNQTFSSLIDLLSKENDIRLQCSVLEALSKFSLTNREFQLSQEIHQSLTKAFENQIENLSKLRSNRLIKFEKNKILSYLSTLWSLTYKSENIGLKIGLLFTGNQYQRSYSQEWLSYKLSDVDLQILERIMSFEKQVLDKDEFSHEFFFSSLTSYVLKSYLVYLAGKNGLKESVQWGQSCPDSNEPLLAQTLNWALSQ
jgi:hypothetical protein